MSKFWEKFFYVLTFVTQGASYLNPRAYALLHREHHLHSDTEKDPHSPLFCKNPAGMMWSTLINYLKIYDRRYELTSAVSHYPEWPAFDRIADSLWVRFAWILAYVAFYVKFATNPWLYLLLPIHFFMGPIHGAIVNWCGHKYGYQNYDNKDCSRNTFFWDLLTMGELMQNNHHRHGMSVNFAKKWFEIDPTYPIIYLLSQMRIVRLKKVSA